VTDGANQDPAELGKEAARSLYHDGLKAAVHDPLEARFAEAAVIEFARLQRERTPGIYRDALEGAEKSAEQLNVEPFRGIAEVVQNADDARASQLRLALRTGARGRELLFVHDGVPVRLNDLVAMAIAFVSTKQEEAGTKGRFGIGLKTLRAIGDALSVHSGHYHASITGSQLAPVSPASPIAGFYEPATGETLLVLELRSDFHEDEFRAWLGSWDASSLLFLDTVRAVELHSLRPRKKQVELRLEERKPRTVPLAVGRHTLDCEETVLRDPIQRRAWRRYVVHRPVPASAPKRRHKATGRTTQIGVAVPDSADTGAALLYAGLPLGDTRIGFPFSANAQFNVDTARTGAQHDEWNGWLLDRVVDLTVAVARQRFATEPSTGWISVPLVTEAETIDDRWLQGRLVAGARAVQERLVRALTFEIGGANRRTRDLVYEARPFERILSGDDLVRLHPDLAPLPWPMRDRGGRWRTVLAEIDLAQEVEADDALRLLEFDNEQLGTRPVSWFIRFARAAISSGEEAGLLWRSSVVLADGSRIRPLAPDVEAAVLVRKTRKGSLATQLGLARVIHGAYLTASPEATAVRRWLENSGILVDDVGPEPSLRALANRGTNPDMPPIELSDEDVLVLRDALGTLKDADQQKELGPEIGGAVSVKGFRWERGKRVRAAVTPATAYLPATFEDRPDGWAKAAGTCPGPAWIEPRYAKVLKRPGSDRRMPAALSFFRLLGAAVAPRLVGPATIETRYGDPASPIDFRALTPSQLEILGKRHATHLKGELLSPDLGRVVGDISRDRSRRRKRERARALLLTLDREWKDQYQGHETATAVYSYGSWVPTGTLPASWLAIARDTPWLTNEAGTPTPPRQLVVRTRLTEALYGRDAPSFASDVVEGLASSPAVRGLGLTADPRIDELVDQLTQLAESPDGVDHADVAIRYAALAAAVTNVDVTLESMVGDLTVRQLRARFGNDRRRPGLILVDGKWLPPAKVMRGRPIFGRRRAFVPDASRADRLWRVLGIPPPTVSDCVSVLTEIGSGPPSRDDEQVLADTYVYLSERVAEASRRERRAIAALPLWSGERWLTQRPIYAVDEVEVARSLGKKLAVWQPPLSRRALGPLVEVLGVTVFDDGDFTPILTEADWATGQSVGETFAAAVDHLGNWLGSHDPALYRALEPGWDELADADIAVGSGLQLELRIAGKRPIRVPARAHLVRSPLQLCFASERVIGDKDAGGRVIAALFAQGDPDKVALAWADSWLRASSGERTARMRPAEDEREDDSMDELFRQAAMTRKPMRRSKPEPAKPIPAGNGRALVAGTIETVRRLKSADDLIVSSVTRPDGAARTGEQAGRRGLREDAPAGRRIGEGRRPAPLSAVQAYAPQEQEHIALEALHRAINGELSDLRDFRHLQGVGADALDRLKRAFEIKSFARDMPNKVTLTANEYERALKDATKYYLAVVSGLEEGFDTVVRIIGNPAATLKLQESTSIVLVGVRSANKPIEVRFSRRQEAEPSGAP
jgi:hypothetical protein